MEKELREVVFREQLETERELRLEAEAEKTSGREERTRALADILDERQKFEDQLEREIRNLKEQAAKKEKAESKMLREITSMKKQKVEKEKEWREKVGNLEGEMKRLRKLASQVNDLEGLFCRGSIASKKGITLRSSGSSSSLRASKK